MKKIFPYATVRELIQRGGYGSYRLFVLPDNNLVGGSHLQVDPNESEAKMKVDDLIIDLEANIDLLGNGLYRIVLKKTNKTQTSGEVIYNFEVRDEGQGVVTAQGVGMGITADKLDEMVNERVKKLFEVKTAEMEKQQEILNLKKEIEELKKSKRTPQRKKNSDLGAILNIGLVAGSAFITEHWPNTKPIVEKALGSIAAINGEEEEEEEEEGTGFSKPE